tara:strand:+ start:4225 stop:4407 length:183 start_codon:yes stop_codon:yes gene_type:complete
MTIKLIATDDDGIETTATLDHDLTDVEELEDAMKLIVKFMLKAGAEFPEEIEEFINDTCD